MHIAAAMAGTVNLPSWFTRIAARRRLVLAGLALLCASGCALNSQGDREISDLLVGYERDRSQETVSYSSLQRRPADASPIREPLGTLEQTPMLAGMIAIALEHNPDILAAIDVARSMASRVPQATALPDPFLSTKTLPEPVRTAEGDNYFVLGVQQKLLVPEKLDRRGRVALEDARIAMERLEQARLRVIGDVKRVYFQLYAIDNTITITEENMVLLRDLIEVTRGQLVAGRGQQEDVLRSQVELSNLESRLVELRQRRITTTSLLNALLDRPYTTPVPAPPDYDVRRVDLQVGQLLLFAAETNPELKQLDRQIARDEQGVRLAKLAYWPDFTIGFEWMQMDPRAAFRPPINPQTGMRPRAPQMSEDGSDNWAITFGFNIPLWFEKIEAGIREARHKLSASRHQFHSARNLVTFRVQDALARVRSFRDIANLFATTIIPQAEQAYEVSRAGYAAGTSDFQYVIDNWQKWLLFRIQYYRTLAELERSVADLEQVVGISLVNAQEQARSPAKEPERSVPTTED